MSEAVPVQGSGNLEPTAVGPIAGQTARPIPCSQCPFDPLQGRYAKQHIEYQPWPRPPRSLVTILEHRVLINTTGDHAGTGREPSWVFSQSLDPGYLLETYTCST